MVRFLLSLQQKIAMKPSILLLGLLFIGLGAHAQDEDSFVIDFGAFVLEEQPDIFSDEYNFTYTGSYPLTPLNFDKKIGSYWEPVDMMAAISQQNRREQRAVQLRPINVKSYGFSTRSSYSDDGQSKVQNIAYRDMRGLQILDPCPPIGMCWRCAPYRSNRAFR